jgi:glycosyltransferase involved in cell wall biosynthesis
MLRYKPPEKILICVPTYHSPKEWLERSTNSIANQTYPHFDCFLVKDSCSFSKENCLECDLCLETDKFCNKLCKSDSRFRYYNLPLHCSGAGWGPRNFAIMNTDHEFISYLDDDNWYEPDHIESLYNSMKEKGSDLAYTGTRIIDKNGKLVSTRIHNNAPKQGYIDTSEIMHKRWLIYKYGGWRYVKKCNDWDLVSRWKDFKWSHTNKITLNFFLRENCGVHRK